MKRFPRRSYSLPHVRADAIQREEMKSRILFLLLVSLALISPSSAAKVTEHIALTVEEFDIPIVVVVPESPSERSPVIYHVHGGGWNGGTATTVPDASVPAGLRLLTDELGIIHVGLAYRGKVQGNFFEALQDIRDSIAWFEARADEFGADLSRVGFSGGSAGTTLSSLLAQEYPACHTYIGLYGVYDLLNNTASLFPDEEARADFGISTESTQRAASAYHHLRANPPAALLFHGEQDILTHRSQSIRFAKKLRHQGASAEAIIHLGVNHGFFSERYPVVFKTTLMRIAQWYVEYQGVDTGALPSLESAIDRRVAGHFPQDEIKPASVLGSWKNKHDTYTFSDDSNGTWTNRRNEAVCFSFDIQGSAINLKHQSGETTLYLQQNGRALYMITENDPRRNGQRFNYTKQRTP